MSLFQRLNDLKSKPAAASFPASPAQLSEGREIRGPEGVYWLIESHCHGQVCLPGDSIQCLLKDLELIRGIGPVHAGELRNRGIKAVDQLVDHPRWKTEASAVLDGITRADIPLLRRRGARDHQWLGFFDPEELLFLDLETTGLWASQPLFLIGLLYQQEGKLLIRQFLARHTGEERAALSAVLAEAPRFKVMVTYNGKQFDVPYLAGRTIAHRLTGCLSHHQLDLLSHARRRYRGEFPDCRLVTMEEQLLGFKREGDIPGYLIPEAYWRYTRTQDSSIIRNILHHNALDLIAMARLLHLLVPPH